MRAKVSADERGEGGYSLAAAGSGAGRAGAVEFAAKGGDGAGGYGLSAGPGAFDIGTDGSPMTIEAFVTRNRAVFEPTA